MIVIFIASDKFYVEKSHFKNKTSLSTTLFLERFLFFGVWGWGEGAIG